VSQPTQDVLLKTIKDMCAKVASDFGVDAMQRDLLSAVATVVQNERAFANGDQPSIQPKIDNTVFDLGVRISDNKWLVESDSE
jgi:hypothetical protein